MVSACYFYCIFKTWLRFCPVCPFNKVRFSHVAFLTNISLHLITKFGGNNFRKLITKCIFQNLIYCSKKSTEKSNYNIFWLHIFYRYKGQYLFGIAEKWQKCYIENKKQNFIILFFSLFGSFNYSTLKPLRSDERFGWSGSLAEIEIKVHWQLQIYNELLQP